MKHIIRLIPFMIIIALWWSYPHFASSGKLPSYSAQKEWTISGTYGDSFGALNTLFSGLALCALLLNIYLQSAQIKSIQENESGRENERQRLALYERRFRVYVATLEYYYALGRKKAYFESNEFKQTEVNFIVAYREAKFLFGSPSPIYDNLKEIYDDTSGIAAYRRLPIPQNKDEEYSKKGEDIKLILADFGEKIQYFEKMFDPFLDFKSATKVSSA